MISAAFTDNLLNLAAIVYRPEDDADSLLRDFAIALIHKGHKLGGLVQRNEKNDQHQHAAMELIDLMTGCVFPISQAGRDCKLDPGALANAALAIGRALDAGVELVIVNKFSAQEAAGKGLRNELAAAATTGLPSTLAPGKPSLEGWGRPWPASAPRSTTGGKRYYGGMAPSVGLTSVRHVLSPTSIRRSQSEARLRSIAYHSHSLANNDVRRLDHRRDRITDFEAKVVHGFIRD
jgi:hypothetical protein